MKKPKIWCAIGILIIIVIGVVYLFTQKIAGPTSANVNAQARTPELRDINGFMWFKHWDEINLDVVKEFYQRYTLDEMQILWHGKLFNKYGNWERLTDAGTFSPWNVYLERLLELGHPFLDFSDYESALETRMCVLAPTHTYWRTLNITERETYLNARGLSPNTTWETYEVYLIKQSVVYRINWWRSGGIDPF